MANVTTVFGWLCPPFLSSWLEVVQVNIVLMTFIVCVRANCSHGSERPTFVAASIPKRHYKDLYRSRAPPVHDTADQIAAVAHLVDLTERLLLDVRAEKMAQARRSLALLWPSPSVRTHVHYTAAYCATQHDTGDTAYASYDKLAMAQLITALDSDLLVNAPICPTIGAPTAHLS